MANLIKKNGGQQELQTTEWSPWRAMREMLRWDPFREMAPVFPNFERAEFAPTFDVTETKDGYVFKADIPGVKPEELDITMTGNRLQIAGKREFEKEDKTETIYTYERQYGSFCRTFTLPDGADVEHATSELKEGVLTLVVPKAAGAQAKKIEVKAGAAKS